MAEDLEAAFDQAAFHLQHAKSVCVLTGAGVSAESGVPTFRAADGLWEGHRIEEVASPQGWRNNPELVWNFYHLRRANVATVKPNPGHFALARMEQHWGREKFTLVTQNVDGLHREAGNQNLLEVHGSLRRTRCLGCGYVVDRGLEALSGIPECPDCGGTLRPDIVWFGEMLPQDVWQAAELAAYECEVFLVVGTSAVVYPAAGLISIARGGGIKQPPGIVIECNLTRTEASHHADVGLYGPSGVTLPRLCERLAL